MENSDKNIVESIEPVFIRAKDYSNTSKLNSYDLCIAASRIVGHTNIDGAQLVNGLWRIYPKSLTSRVHLVTKGQLFINSIALKIFDKNPSLNARELYEKITIKELPLHITDSEIEQFLRNRNVELTSEVKYSMARTTDGDITSFKNGDRYAFVKAPVMPLLKRIDYIGEYKCKIYHDSQFKTNCSVCNMLGHSEGDTNCNAKNKTEEIIAFRSQNNVLSNFYPCTISIYDTVFKSTEHAYQYKQAIAADMDDLAEQIMRAPHAGVAKRLSKEIPEAFRISWEKNNVNIMNEILNVKADQVPEFAYALCESDGTYLAEATSDTFWASGLSPEVTAVIDPSFYPGSNTLGKLLMEIRGSLLEVNSDEKFSNDEEDDNHSKQSQTDTEVEERTSEPSQNANTNPAVNQQSETRSQQADLIQPVTETTTTLDVNTEKSVAQDNTDKANKKPVITAAKFTTNNQGENKRRASKTPEKDKSNKQKKK